MPETALAAKICPFPSPPEYRRHPSTYSIIRHYFHRPICGASIYDYNFIYKFCHTVETACNMLFFIFDNHAKAYCRHIVPLSPFDLLSTKFLYAQIHIDSGSPLGWMPCELHCGTSWYINDKISWYHQHFLPLYRLCICGIYRLLTVIKYRRKFYEDRKSVV